MNASRVFPTCVGVFLFILFGYDGKEGLPHVRGGVSGRPRPKTGSQGSSPRAWGCFQIVPVGAHLLYVFPTCVGVFLAEGNMRPLKWCLPHVRGGVSFFRSSITDFVLSSPRAWGCFSMQTRNHRRHRVFPTCVGVFLFIPAGLSFSGRLPHVRGGVSIISLDIGDKVLSSPRAWGCF